MLASYLDRTIRAAGIPIDGVSIGVPTDRTTWRVMFLTAATTAQRTEAANIITNLDLAAAANDAADQAALVEVDGRAIKATLEFILRRVLGRVPTPAERQTARTDWMTIFKALA